MRGTNIDLYSDKKVKKKKKKNGVDMKDYLALLLSLIYLLSVFLKHHAPIHMCPLRYCH